MSVSETLTENQLQTLVAANLLTKRWYEKLGSNVSSLVKFVAILQKNPDSLVEGADEETTAQFYNDLKQMLYPTTVENEIIEGYHRLVCKLVNKYRMHLIMDEDEAISVGNFAVRNAIWYYDRISVKFISFAYRAIKSKFIDLIKAKHDANKSVKLVSVHAHDENSKNSSDFVVATNIFDSQKPSSRTPKSRAQGRQFSLFNDVVRTVSIRYLINNACYDEMDRKVIDLFLSHPKSWIEEFKKLFVNPANGQEYCNYAVRLRLKRVCDRMRDIADSQEISLDDIILDLQNGETHVTNA